MKPSSSKPTCTSNDFSDKLNARVQKLKIYGTDDSNRDASQAVTRSWEGNQVRVSLKQLLPVLLQAAVDQSAWLDDFEDETIIISKDFHEVLSCFNDLRKKHRAAA